MIRPRQFDDDEAIEAAMQRFWRHGYEATSVHDLAEAMGIAGPSLSNAFKDKRPLFVRALGRYCEVTMRSRLASVDWEGSQREAIEGLFAQVVKRSLSDPERRGCFLVNSALEVAPHDAEIGRKIARYLDEICSFFERNIRAARAIGQIGRVIDSCATASQLLATLLGIRVLARASPDRVVLENAAQSVLAALGPARPSTQRTSKP